MKRKPLMLIKLLDQTLIWSRDSKVNGSIIEVNEGAFGRQGEVKTSIDSSMNISLDAVETYLIAHKGGKKPAKPEPGPYNKDGKSA